MDSGSVKSLSRSFYFLSVAGLGIAKSSIIEFLVLLYLPYKEYVKSGKIV